jgi:hypothetical protein
MKDEGRFIDSPVSIECITCERLAWEKFFAASAVMWRFDNPKTMAECAGEMADAMLLCWRERWTVES